MVPTDSTPQSTVLLVDDEELLRRLLSRILTEAGFGVVEAENGAVALETARRINGGLQLVVTDVHMPVMDGMEFARQFRPLHPAVPILFITGRDLPAGPDEPVPNKEMLRKPFRSEAFLAMVSQLVANRVA
jgi:CheY-like chemotaxis protein